MALFNKCKNSVRVIKLLNSKKRLLLQSSLLLGNFNLARKMRLFFKDVSQHILIHGIDNETIFKDEEDYQTFLKNLEVLVADIEIELHAYVLMPRYFQFLATPLNEQSISKFMQMLGRRYVGYFNKKYNRTGSLWNGRYRASLVEQNRYFLEVMQSIERKPQDEKNCKDFKEYPYSSINKNALFKDNAIVTPHRDFDITTYLQLLDTKRDKEIANFIALSLEKQTITGSREFSRQLEQKLGVALGSSKRGRPKKTNIRKKMYKNLEIISKTKHKNLKVSAIKSLSFAKDLKFIPTVYSETALLSDSYPVVITNEKEPSLGIIVALDGGNLSIRSDGKWYGSYIPAYLKKYPFTLGVSKEYGESALMLLDLDSSLVSPTEGEPLFNEDGSQSEMFKEKIKLVTTYVKERKITAEIIQILMNANILEQGEIIIGEGEERKSLVSGFQAVSRTKYEALDNDIKKSWERAGITAFIEAHLKSLNNINKLFILANREQS